MTSTNAEETFGLVQARWIVWGLLVPVHILLLSWLACRMSPTSDEIAHLAAGVRIWTLGQFDVYPVNPPLVKAIAALPVVLDPPQGGWDLAEIAPRFRPEWVLGLNDMRANTPRFRWDFVLARWMCLPFCILGLITCFRWGNELFGPRAGILSATLWCFSPNILGNGALITPDVPAAALGVTTLFYFRRWLVSFRWSDAFIVGLLLGLTQLAKMTWLLLYGLLPLIWIVFELLSRASRDNVDSQRHRPHSSIRCFQTIFLLFISLDVLNVGYLFDRTLQPLGSFQFVSASLSGESTGEVTGNRFKESWLSAIPVPFPAPYITGLDLQRRDFEGNWKPLVSYLRGELRNSGWWYYYAYGLLVKVSLGTWLIAACCLMASVGSAMRTILHSDDGPHSGPYGVSTKEWLLLLLPPLVLFLFVSSQTGFTRYFRYVLPCFPFCFISLGSVWSRCGWQRLPGRAWVAGVGMLCTIGASLSVFPHSLSYFNLIAGGLENGHWHLLDSNVDWGQDLYSLKDWIDQHPEATPLHLAYAGVADPHLFDIQALPFPDVDARKDQKWTPGWYAVSVNHLHGYDSAPEVYSRLLAHHPVDRAGYSILIYRLTEEMPP